MHSFTVIVEVWALKFIIKHFLKFLLYSPNVHQLKKLTEFSVLISDIYYALNSMFSTNSHETFEYLMAGPMNITIFWDRPCHSPGNESPASHSGNPGQIPAQVMWDLWQRKQHWGSFSEYFRFLCHSFIPLTAPQSSSCIIQCWYHMPINICSNSGLGSTPSP
jgi:hypothetical protein